MDENDKMGYNNSGMMLPTSKKTYKLWWSKRDLHLVKSFFLIFMLKIIFMAIYYSLKIGPSKLLHRSEP